MDEISVLEANSRSQIEWLDNERRNDKNNLASLQNRLTVLEGKYCLAETTQEMETEIVEAHLELPALISTKLNPTLKAKICFITSIP